jgi:hypothetical protein
MVRFDSRRVSRISMCFNNQFHAHATGSDTLPALLSGCLTQQRCECW